jgi:hypothetical protein
MTEMTSYDSCFNDILQQLFIPLHVSNAIKINVETDDRSCDKYKYRNDILQYLFQRQSATHMSVPQ